MKLPARRTLALLAFGSIFLAGFGWVVTTQGPLAPVKVTVAKAREMTLDRTLFGIGTVEARHAYAIGPTVAGRVARVLVDQGDSVKLGQLLAEMDPIDLESRQLASSASAARAEQLVSAAQAALAEASSRAHLSQTSAERFADLRRKNFVSQEAADIKVHEAAAARAAQSAAAAALAAAKDEVRRARSELAGLNQNRAHLRLISPVDGIISARQAEPGATVVAGQAVLQVIDPATLWLRVRIDQGRSSGLALGLPAAIVLRSRPGQVLTGRVARIDITGDAVTEERIANVNFDALPAQLAIGELAEVTLRLQPVDKVLSIPSAALTRQGNDQGVWRLVDGRPQFTAVSTGILSANGLVQITRGLATSDAVIIYSGKALTPDLRVKVVDSLVKTPQ